jgi:hypothetical protein
MPLRRQVSAIHRERDRLAMQIVFQINVRQRREAAVSKNYSSRQCIAFTLRRIVCQHDRRPSRNQKNLALFAKLNPLGDRWQRNKVSNLGFY